MIEIKSSAQTFNFYLMKRQLADFVSGGIIESNNTTNISTTASTASSSTSTTLSTTQTTKKSLQTKNSNNSTDLCSSEIYASLIQTTAKRRNIDNDMTNKEVVEILDEAEDNFFYCDLCKFFIPKQNVNDHLTTIKHNFEQVRRENSMFDLKILF